MPLPATPIPESPSANKEWHIGFLIPDLDVFSAQVLQAINTGVVTSSARREIVQVLRTYVLAHTCNPKSEHYNAVCRKLVDKYPKLQDTEGDTLYVSETKIVSFHVEIDGNKAHGKSVFDIHLKLSKEAVQRQGEVTRCGQGFHRFLSCRISIKEDKII